MFNYFKELLATLKKIERHLSRLASCVKEDRHGNVDRYSISIKHRNDG